MHQIVHKDQCVYIHHVVTVNDVNLLQVDYDPINRHLIDEENEDEKRILFIVSYSSRLQTYNTVMNTFHLYFISFRLYYSYYKEILSKIKNPPPPPAGGARGRFCTFLYLENIEHHFRKHFDLND